MICIGARRHQFVRVRPIYVSRDFWRLRSSWRRQMLRYIRLFNHRSVSIYVRCTWCVHYMNHSIISPSQKTSLTCCVNIRWKSRRFITVVHWGRNTEGKGDPWISKSRRRWSKGSENLPYNYSSNVHVIVRYVPIFWVVFGQLFKCHLNRWCLRTATNCSSFLSFYFFVIRM